jgi:hypothetical protein
MDQGLDEAWHARQCVSPIYPVRYLAPEGLLLGAGAVLVPADAAGRLTSLGGVRHEQTRISVQHSL